ncbi:uncharacterized protein LOC112351060 [Selaginella moellendorffii]|uniref:uncharacterized protein LOC112351060 n=1 Tax=Selaginella moellendorffii TaxID=88036 RepID=UPI000D1C803F|nr:uncharacterized protein LOC112351060 [Selaginella moellendorffii]|eukprot:XP_024543966.1 uncharacterized protein LOC112351060 [Selaginella moellendorffii]
MGLLQLPSSFSYLLYNPHHRSSARSPAFPSGITCSAARVERAAASRRRRLVEIGAVSDEKFRTIAAAAVALPIGMAAMAVFGAFLLQRQIRMEALRDGEEFIKLVEGGMDEETAKNTILSRIEIIGPDLRSEFRRKRPQIQDKIEQEQQQDEQEQEQEQQTEEPELDTKIQTPVTMMREEN